MFPTLGGTATDRASPCRCRSTSSTGAPMHNINVNVSRTLNQTVNQYAVVDRRRRRRRHHRRLDRPVRPGVCRRSRSRACRACATWSPRGAPTRRVSTGYGWTRPCTTHTLRLGGDVRVDRSDNQTDANARGAFVFTGLYTSGGCADRARRRPRLRRLPARPAAAGHGAVRARQRAAARQVAQRVRPGRLARRAQR